jgi:hypothetical protein
MRSVQKENNMAIDNRHRDKNGIIGRKYGNTAIRNLRQMYGESFAIGIDGNKKLSDILHDLDELSLAKLINRK